MRRLSWPLSPLPDGQGEVWRWQLGTIGELSAARSELRHRLSDVDIAPGARRDARGPDDEATESLVLAFDELASNALRHGETPVVAALIAGCDGWLLDVSDHAPAVSPDPAVDRDPAQGGLGLHMVARLARAHGWYVDEGCKHVWACLPATVDQHAMA